MTLIAPDFETQIPMVARASGCRIAAEGGAAWIDACSGAISSNVGHAHPHVLERINWQLHRADFVYRSQFTSEPAERLAQRLCERHGYAGAFFVNSGSEAVETAVRMARMHWTMEGRPRKQHVLSRSISYHGSTHLTLSLSGHWPRRRDAAIAGQGPTLPTPYPMRRPVQTTTEHYAAVCAQAVEDEILRVGADEIAAVILEPIVGASGAAIIPPEDYLRRVRAICRRHEVLLIADEVLTGIGRTGAWLAQDHWSIKADIVALGKGLNGGYIPISAILVSDDILERLQRNDTGMRLGHTHSNHPVACACANAVLDVIEGEDLVLRAASEGERFGRHLLGACEKSEVVAEVRGRGMFWGVEISIPDDERTPFPAQARVASQIVQAASRAGILVYPAIGFVDRSRGDAVILAPPLNAPCQTLEELCGIFGRVLENCESAILKQEKTNG